ncbi:MAG: YdcH family protein [Alphaproteobacteria bacterium]
MDEDDLKQKLIALKEEHRDLDDALTALDRAGTFDQVQMQRLKKKKLRIRDKIQKIENDLLPDIIA